MPPTQEPHRFWPRPGLTRGILNALLAEAAIIAGFWWLWHAV